MKCSLITFLQRRLLLITPTKLIRIFKLIKCILNEKDTNITFLSMQNNSHAISDPIIIISPSLRIFPISLNNSRFNVSNLLSTKKKSRRISGGTFSLGCHPSEDHEIILPPLQAELRVLPG